MQFPLLSIADLAKSPEAKAHMKELRECMDRLVERISNLEFTEESGRPGNLSQYGIKYFDFSPKYVVAEVDDLVDEFILFLRCGKDAGAEKIIWREIPEITSILEEGKVDPTVRIYARLHFMPDVGRLAA